MKKNKKLFLASIAAMGAVAIGTGAVSTFAWFGVSQTVKRSSDTKTITINNAAQAGDWYLVLEMSGIQDVDFTDKNGKTWGVSNSRLVEASQSKAYDDITLTPKLYKTRTGSEGAWVYDDETTENERKGLSGDPVKDFTIVASDRARITYNNPTAMTASDGDQSVGETNFHKAFYDDSASPKELFENTLNIKIKVTTSTGALSVSINGGSTYTATATLYFSVCGQSTNVAQSVGADATSITDNYASDHIYGQIVTGPTEA